MYRGLLKAFQHFWNNAPGAFEKSVVLLCSGAALLLAYIGFSQWVFPSLMLLKGIVYQFLVALLFFWLFLMVLAPKAAHNLIQIPTAFFTHMLFPIGKVLWNSWIVGAKPKKKKKNKDEDDEEE